MQRNFNVSPDKRFMALEAIRGLAALYVVLHHFAHFMFANQYPNFARLFVFGQAAVMIFFIMSGFVIFHSVANCNHRMGFFEYFVRRFRRIYPLFLAALALSYLTQCIVHHAVLTPNLRELLGNLLLLQDNGAGNKPGTWFSPFMGNTPLWSLSYEWFFYMAFFPIYSFFYHREPLQKYAVLALSLIGFASFSTFPNEISLFLIYFVLWWSGVELAREYTATRQVTWRGQFIPLFSIAVLAMLWFLNVWDDMATGLYSPWQYPVLQFRHFITAWGILVAGLLWYRANGIGFNWLFGWARHLAPISYALYICHMAIINLASGLQLTGSVWLDFIWSFTLIIAISYLLEIKFQPWINRVISVR